MTNPQKSVWYTEKLNPGTTIGTICATLKVESPLKYEIVEQAINTVIQRNEAFRIRIVEEAGEPKQYIGPEEEYFKLDYVDFTGQSVEKLYEWDSEQSKIVIPELNNKLYYFAFLKLDERNCAIFTRIHHLISDAWSVVQIGNEILENYVAIEKGDTLAKDNNPSYLEYLEKEVEYMQSKKYLSDQIFWKERYAELPDLTTLKSRVSNETTIKSVRKTFVLPEKLTKQIREFCKENRTSIFALFYSALCMYINRVKGKEKVTIGVPVLNRTNPREKRMIGMFISTVPLTVEVNDEMNFMEFSKVVGKTWLSVLKHQKYPYENILKEVREMHKGTEKLYDIAISYQNAKMIKNSHGLKHEARWHSNGYQMESLYIHVNDREDDGRIILNYDFIEDLFYKKEIEFINDHIIRLLWHALDNPQRELYKVHMLSEVETKKVVHDFNQTDADYPRDRVIHEVFEEQAQKNPEATALIYQDKTYSYKWLNERANQIAHLLLDKGVKEEEIIALLFNRSPEMIASILGVLKAGCAYLPIDPGYPEERINTIMADSGATILLRNVDDEENYQCLVNMYISEELLCSYCKENLNLPIQGNRLAYIIYTSGSTGNPKGVMIEHRNVMALILNKRLEFDFNEKDVWANFHSYCFDVSVWEMYGALLYGSSLLLLDKEIVRDPRDFLQKLIENKVTVLCQIPVAFYNLMQEELRQKEKSLKLRYVIFAGESLKPFMLDAFKQRYPETTLVNMYGVTEATVYQTYKEITEDDILNASDNIGRPLSGDYIYIVDRNLQPAPIGAMGEMMIGGEGVARGYLNRPDLTASRFIDNPFMKGDRLYRTGDFARWFPEGEIEYLGRMDHQIKIRGHRVELGEIEKKILSFSGIRKAAVIAKNDDQDKKILCAYYVADSLIEQQDVKEYLIAELPAYMVPAYYLQMDSFPLTSTGKVDVKSLPEPNKFIQSDYAAPEDENQRIIAEIWQEILDVEKVGIDDNFFDLGGDSLSAVRFSSYLYQYELRIDLQDIYRHPTIKGLSKHVCSIDKEAVGSQEPTSLSGGKLFKQTSQSITDRIILNDLPKLDSAALTYIPEDFLMLNRTSKKEVIEGVFQDEPVLYHRIAGEEGTIGVFALPLINSELYTNQDRLLEKSRSAILLAEQLGAKVVSLTGLIPSATSYGEDIQRLIDESNSSIKVTSGHTTTAASVILSIERLLADSGRIIGHEQVGVLGLGSIGSTAIKLLIRIGHHPKCILLCDIESKQSYLESLKIELRELYGYKGTINIAYAKPDGLPSELYDSSLIIGATNVADVLDVEKLKAGTLIIDDSGPHCFAKEKAIERLLHRQDILFTEGGVLEAPTMMSKMTYFPKQMTTAFKEKYQQNFTSGPDITGCILSSLLSAKHSNLKPVVGNVDIEDCMCHYETLTELGYKGAHLHCDDFLIDQVLIEKFRSRYSQ
ncbi:amino acid adenylation domain-containing protein [Clostridia bacterium]|nr:amino acid adenylation domain-containing protein [Clostridia bacterium]